MDMTDGDMASSLAQPVSQSAAQPDSATPDWAATMAQKLRTESGKPLWQLIRSLANHGEPGWELLLPFLLERSSQPATAAEGAAYQVLKNTKTDSVLTVLQTHFPQGVVTDLAGTIDHQPLQQALASQAFQDADRLTLQALCQLAGEAAVQRKWLYFSEVKLLPVEDLRTIDRLWRIYSDEKFGFSVQRQLWLGVGKTWDALWPKIGWRSGNEWTRYPQGFTWDLTAPIGHLPLSNQLRGVQVMQSLLSHPAWEG